MHNQYSVEHSPFQDIYYRSNLVFLHGCRPLEKLVNDSVIPCCQQDLDVCGNDNKTFMAEVSDVILCSV